MSGHDFSVLLPVELRQIGDSGETNSVDARQLWRSLGVRKDFSDWWRQQVKSLDLVDGVDFVLLHLKGEQDWGGSNRKDYAIALDTAKGIAMASRTKSGKAVRRYFVECEKLALKAPQTNAEKILEVIGLLQGQVEEERAARQIAEAKIAKDRSKVEYAEDMALAEGMVSTAGAFARAGVREKLNSDMWAALDGPGGYFVNRPGEERHWRVALRKQGLGDDSYQKMRKANGRKIVVVVPKWTAKGVQHLRQWILARRRQSEMRNPRQAARR